ncbi:Kelch repeat-containing protein [Plebeiibacterium sediminum]|uniref:DNA-binding transcriptional activator n=1 Tax=Plebeiibacterium sediminum TaxID=2992112 RepID=A0AAE3SFZ2_9BACT|nr:kelch repeat-containing protein [Plebeiobacterium sediminum]MCW3787935.1 hypothetical protein [Plebeiobacterium sediminum]
MALLIKLQYIPLLILSFLTYQQNVITGLKFKGNEEPIKNRGSYNVFNNYEINFLNYFEIEFDIAVYTSSEFGYILRIKNKNIPKIYNLFCEELGEDLVFKLNEEGIRNLASIRINKKELIASNWFKIFLRFDLKNNEIQLKIKEHDIVAKNTNLPNTYTPEIIFGKSDHLIDVPSFAIKNLSVGNKLRYFFPLRESHGNIVYSQKGKALGYVSNPEWLINEAYNWKKEVSFSSNSVAGANFNTLRDELYYFNNDSITIYNVVNKTTEVTKFSIPCPVKMLLGTNFLDAANNIIYDYEVYYDSIYAGPTVASLDISTLKWSTLSYDKLPTQLHHHGSYYDIAKKQYILFGGFGNMHYSKDFNAFDINSRKWKTLQSFQGDVIMPRYFTSMGYSKQNDLLYVFGGMGNESGEQILGRQYLYDLHSINLKTKEIKKLWEIKWENNNVVPVRGMLLLNDSVFYTLCYPEHFTNSFLKLYKFSINDGSYEILGDSIPIKSDKINTNANLYYDTNIGKLYTIIQEFGKYDIKSELKVYSISYPSITANQLSKFPNNNSKLSLIKYSILIGGAIIIILLVFLLIRIQKKKQDFKNQVTPTKKRRTIPQIPNAIYLFGNFTVYNKKNKDISYMFSTRLIELFCLVMKESQIEGISSKKISSILWPYKEKDKIKNIRGVTINNLRKGLAEIEGVELIYNKGYYLIKQSDVLYCDYIRLIQIINENQFEKNKEEFFTIISRGKFLKGYDQPLLDQFKESIEAKIEPFIISELERSYAEKNYQTTIEVAETMFNIDPINELAIEYLVKSLQKLKRNDEALIRQQAFLIDYKQTMGYDFTSNFKL